jgi:hypothetical protein
MSSLPSDAVNECNRDFSPTMFRAVISEGPTIRELICSVNAASSKRGQCWKDRMSIRLFRQAARTCYFGTEHEKFAALSVLPIPVYVATFG